MRWFCWAILFGWAVGLAASPGTVQTVDGRSFAGDLRLTNGFLLIESTNGALARFAPGDVLVANFMDPDAGAAAGGSGNGLLGHYFGNTNLTGNVIIRLDEAVDFDWSIGEPVSGAGTDYFGIVWSGEVEAPAAGDFTFWLEADEHAVLSLDGKQIVESRSRRIGEETASAPIAWEAGKRYPLQLTYFDWTGGARAAEVVRPGYREERRSEGASLCEELQPGPLRQRRDTSRPAGNILPGRGVRRGDQLAHRSHDRLQLGRA